MRAAPLLSRRLPRAALAAMLCIPLLACKMPTDDLPRNQSLPLFNPHMPTFACAIEASKVPPIDAEAEAWFLEALALEDPEILREERDHPRILLLTRKAAERRHWKAMLNLATLYLQKQDPEKGVEDAVKLVEEAMRLGIPGAYDRMGTYHMNGTGVDSDATRAFAFWQKAAELGSPHAMTFLGEKLDATWDSGNGTHWANKLIARQMLECALGQGFGPAAYQLSFAIAGDRPPSGSTNRTREESARALWALHQGTKFGCRDCANALQIEFDHPFNLADMLAPHVDKARGERYGLLGDAISFDRRLRFPNLDQVLPLPPAPLPDWDGDTDSLINAATGVKPTPRLPKPSAASLRPGRHFLDAGFAFRQTFETTGDERAPLTGYWQPTGHQQPARLRAQLAEVQPGLYHAGEPFEQFFDPSEVGHVAIFGVVWERWDTQWHNDDDVEPRTAAGLVREVAGNAPLMSCPANRTCPVSGVWQPWVHVLHPLRAIVNQHWRQSWLAKGQPFPQPEQDWLLNLPEDDLTWHLLDDAGVNLVREQS